MASLNIMVPLMLSLLLVAPMVATRGMGPAKPKATVLSEDTKILAADPLFCAVDYIKANCTDDSQTYLDCVKGDINSSSIVDNCRDAVNRADACLATMANNSQVWYNFTDETQDCSDLVQAVPWYFPTFGDDHPCYENATNCNASTISDLWRCFQNSTNELCRNTTTNSTEFDCIDKAIQNCTAVDKLDCILQDTGNACADTQIWTDIKAAVAASNTDFLNLVLPCASNTSWCEQKSSYWAIADGCLMNQSVSCYEQSPIGDACQTCIEALNHVCPPQAKRGNGLAQCMKDNKDILRKACQSCDNDGLLQPLGLEKPFFWNSPQWQVGLEPCLLDLAKAGCKDHNCAVTQQSLPTCADYLTGIDKCVACDGVVFNCSQANATSECKATKFYGSTVFFRTSKWIEHIKTVLNCGAELTDCRVRNPTEGDLSCLFSAPTTAGCRNQLLGDMQICQDEVTAVCAQNLDEDEKACSEEVLPFSRLRLQWLGLHPEKFSTNCRSSVLYTSLPSLFNDYAWQIGEVLDDACYEEMLEVGCPNNVSSIDCLDAYNTSSDDCKSFVNASKSCKSDLVRICGDNTLQYCIQSQLLDITVSNVTTECAYSEWGNYLSFLNKKTPLVISENTTRNMSLEVCAFDVLKFNCSDGEELQCLSDNHYGVTRGCLQFLASAMLCNTEAAQAVFPNNDTCNATLAAGNFSGEAIDCIWKVRGQLSWYCRVTPFYSFLAMIYAQGNPDDLCDPKCEASTCTRETCVQGVCETDYEFASAKTYASCNITANVEGVCSYGDCTDLSSAGQAEEGAADAQGFDFLFFYPYSVYFEESKDPNGLGAIAVPKGVAAFTAYFGGSVDDVNVTIVPSPKSPVTSSTYQSGVLNVNLKNGNADGQFVITVSAGQFSANSTTSIKRYEPLSVTGAARFLNSAGKDINEVTAGDVVTVKAPTCTSQGKIYLAIGASGGDIPEGEFAEVFFDEYAPTVQTYVPLDLPDGNFTLHVACFDATGDYQFCPQCNKTMIGHKLQNFDNVLANILSKGGDASVTALATACEKKNCTADNVIALADKAVSGAKTEIGKANAVSTVMGGIQNAAANLGNDCTKVPGLLNAASNIVGNCVATKDKQVQDKYEQAVNTSFDIVNKVAAANNIQNGTCSLSNKFDTAQATNALKQYMESVSRSFSTQIAKNNQSTIRSSNACVTICWIRNPDSKGVCNGSYVNATTGFKAKNDFAVGYIRWNSKCNVEAKVFTGAVASADTVNIFLYDLKNLDAKTKLPVNLNMSAKIGKFRIMEDLVRFKVQFPNAPANAICVQQQGNTVVNITREGDYCITNQPGPITLKSTTTPTPATPITIAPVKSAQSIILTLAMLFAVAVATLHTVS